MCSTKFNGTISKEPSVEKTQYLLHQCVSSNNNNCFIAGKTENQVANSLIDPKFRRDEEVDPYEKEYF